MGNLVLYSDDRQSSAVAVTNGATIQMSNSLIQLCHTQGVGVDGCDITLNVHVNNTGIITAAATDADAGDTNLDRRLSTSVGVRAKNVHGSMTLQKCRVIGFRVGVEVNTSAPEVIDIVDTTLEESSVAVHLTTGCNLLRVDGCVIRNVFDGFLSERPVSDVGSYLTNCCFTNVLSPVKVHRDSKPSVKTESCSHAVSCDSGDSSLTAEVSKLSTAELTKKTEEESEMGEDDGTMLDPSTIDENQECEKSEAKPSFCSRNPTQTSDCDNISEDDLKLFLIVEKNLPYQVAVDSSDLTVVPIC